MNSLDGILRNRVKPALICCRLACQSSALSRSFIFDVNYSMSFHFKRTDYDMLDVVQEDVCI